MLLRPKAALRKAAALFRALCAVLGTGLLSLGDACGIERAADDVVTNAGEIAHAAAADQNGTVLVQVMTLAGNVHGTFLLVRQAYSRDLAERGVRLFGRRGGNGEAYTPLLRAGTHDRGLALFRTLLSAVLDELVDSRHFDLLVRMEIYLKIALTQFKKAENKFTQISPNETAAICRDFKETTMFGLCPRHRFLLLWRIFRASPIEECAKFILFPSAARAARW